ncbi:MAG: C25 family cysteine peptidase [Anaerolineaceae bacterium]|nr:C25 family cysteine peptidase [Anaerolineaceae bacterium]
MINRSAARWVNFTFTLVLLFGVPSSQLPSSSPGGTDVRLQSSDPQGVTLELNLPEFQVKLIRTSDRDCHQVRIPGWGLSGKAGEPALPVKGVLVGQPPDSETLVTIIESSPPQEIEDLDICPSATLKVNSSATGEIGSQGEILKADLGAYQQNQFYPPGPLAELGTTGLIRSQQVAQVLLKPFRYNPVTRKLRYYTKLHVRVQFSSPIATFAQSQPIDEGMYEAILQSQVINYDDARRWRTKAVTIATAQPKAAHEIKLEVIQDGLVRITYSDLQSAGAPVDRIDPQTLRLTSQGNEIAIYVKSENVHEFLPGDYLIFYGQKNGSRYITSNVYWLTWGGANGLRITTADGRLGSGDTPSAFQSLVHFEENTIYLSGYPSGVNQDRWYWNTVYQPGKSSRTYPVDLTRVSNQPATAKMRGLFKGYSANPMHHVHVSINGHLIAENTWPAQEEFTFLVNFPQSYLIEGQNSILVECPLTEGITQETVLVNWFEIEYAKDYSVDGSVTYFSGDNPGTWQYELRGLLTKDSLVWDITDPIHPVNINNLTFTPVGDQYSLQFQQHISARSQYLASSLANIPGPASAVLSHPADLHSTQNGADSIILTHPDFLEAVQPLADYRTAQGFRVKVVNVMDVYDEFRDGLFDPQAIHDFLAYAYQYWESPAPAYVLLVGDGNYDFLNFTKRDEPNFIPPFLADVDPWMGETAADNRYVTVSGDDILPDMALGRLPVKTASEASNVIAKILSYDQHATGDWSRKVMFVADKLDPSAGDFAALSDAIIDGYLNPWNSHVDRVYDQVTHTDLGATRQAILDGLNQGRGIIHYNGHASTTFWSTDQLFQKTDIPLLANEQNLPIIIPMTCLTGYYIHPSSPTTDASSLDESIVRAPNGAGAVATWSPTGLGLSTGHELLDRGIFQAIYRDHTGSLGWATNQAKYFLYANSSSNRALIDTYELFGDPALPLAMSPAPELGTIFLPIALR